jgi:hypothetical protein
MVHRSTLVSKLNVNITSVQQRVNAIQQSFISKGINSDAALKKQLLSNGSYRFQTGCSVIVYGCILLPRSYFLGVRSFCINIKRK